MKITTALALSATASGVLGAVLPQQEPLTDHTVHVHHEPEKFLIELAPYQTRWVTEEEKWVLKLDGVNFIDVTNARNTGTYPSVIRTTNTVHYPGKMEHRDNVTQLARGLSKQNMKQNLEHFTSYHTRYYKSSTGVESATWLYEQVAGLVTQSGADKHGATVAQFAHPWGQSSVIARIPGRSEKTVVVSAHQDSINLFLPSILAAPGADDDGSGTVTILETLRALLQSDDIVGGKAPNTVEFHWYSGEEGGLLGSQEVWAQYRQDRRDVKAMLQQDMTGYVQGTLDAGREEAIGVIVDFVDQDLTKFIKEVITTYCKIPFVETKCGYACSDHASASRQGYAAAMAIEGEMENTNKKIHTTDDQIKYLSFDHMRQHATMALGFVYELAFAPF